MGKAKKLKEERRLERLQQQESENKRWKYIIMLLLIGLVGFIAVISIRMMNEHNQAGQQKDAAVNNQTSTNQEESTPMTESQNPTAIISTPKGDIKVELFEKDAPKTVENFMKLAREDFYNGTTFHRVISEFVIQGGDPNSKDDDPTNDGLGGPGYAFEDEINPKSIGLSDAQIADLEAQGYQYRSDLQSHKMEAGALAMANSGPATNGSQFFIVTEQAQPHLDGRHTVFGKVIEGMDVVRQVEQGDKIESIRVE